MLFANSPINQHWSFLQLPTILIQLNNHWLPTAPCNNAVCILLLYSNDYPWSYFSSIPSEQFILYSQWAIWALCVPTTTSLALVWWPTMNKWTHKLFTIKVSLLSLWLLYNITFACRRLTYDWHIIRRNTGFRPSQGCQYKHMPQGCQYIHMPQGCQYNGQ